MATMFAQPQPRTPAFQRPRDEFDDFLSSDLELSFASSISLNSSPHSPVRQFPPGRAQIPPSPVPMDIYESPIPVSPLQAATTRTMSRSRLSVVGSRSFGRELGNSTQPHLPTNSPGIKDGFPSPSSGVQSTKLRGRQRMGLPSEWLAMTPEPASPQVEVHEPKVLVQVSPCSDSMDIDVPSPLPAPSTSIHMNERTPASEPDFETLFASSPLGALPMINRKRRSISPEPGVDGIVQDSSPDASPLQVDRYSSTGQAGGGSLFGCLGSRKPSLNAACAVPTVVSKRARRPTLSAIIPGHDNSYQAKSANPVLESSSLSPISAALPVRRAFSAHVQPASFMLSGNDIGSDDTSGAEASPARAYSKRQQTRQLRGISAPQPNSHLPCLQQMQLSPLVNRPGIPGFGDNEADGKILPCYKVKEDGLMRIDPHTLRDLLIGAYDDRISSYQVIDCRFDYEFRGGHIPGALNLNSNANIEEHLLGPSKPPSSRSGDGKPGKKILIFHCEFSVKRAPTFAKRLRAQDRALNNHIYPKIHYPEVYILNGGYCSYYQQFPEHCEPRAYVKMDDPQHAQARSADLGNFRKWNRTKSYTYGQHVESNSASPCAALKNPHRNTAPSGVQLPFAAATAAHNRRRGPPPAALSTLPEDAGVSSPIGDEVDTEPECDENGEETVEPEAFEDSEEGFDTEEVTSSPCPRPPLFSNGRLQGSRLNPNRSKLIFSRTATLA